MNTNAQDQLVKASLWSEQGHRMLFESMDEAFCVFEMLFDAQGEPHDYRFLEVNAAFIKMTGCPHAVGTRMRELVPDIEAHWFETYGKVALTGEPIRFVQQSSALDNRWFNLYAFRLGAPEERKVAVLFTDITEARRANDALTMARAELAEIINLAPSFMAVFRGPSFVIEVANDAYRCLAGQRDLIGKPVREAFPEVENQGFFELVERVYATGEPWMGQGVSVFLHKQSGDVPTECFLDLVYQPLRTSDGSINGVFAHGIDITERKQAEEALARTADDAAQQARVFDMSLSAMADFVHTFDRQGRVLYANKAMLTSLGGPAEEVIGKSIFELGCPDALALKIAGQIEQVFATGRPVVDETPITSGAGVLGHFEYNLSAVPGPDGTTYVVTGSSRDITARKRAEEELKEVDRRKTDFLAMLAHELRNPLAPIRNAVQLLQLTSGMPAAVPPLLAMMDRQLGQMVRLIDDLIDVSRIGRGKVELKLGRAALATIVQQTLEAAQPLYERMDQELTVTLPARPIYLQADAARLSQAIGNLLNNASKFSDRGARVQISVARQDEMAVVRVTDNGVGIPGDHLLHIFDMFTQLDTSLARSRGGLGVGLALVKDLIEMHGGTVEAFSAGLGRGSEFVLRMPMLADELASPAALAQEPKAVTPLRILVVDDNADVANAMAALLTSSGHEVATAYDGPQAVNVAARSTFDVMLRDIGLPYLDGYGVARAVRSLPNGADVMLVAMTGWGQDDDRRHALEAGFDAHRTKAVPYEDLCQLLASRAPRPVLS